MSRTTALSILKWREASAGAAWPIWVAFAPSGRFLADSRRFCSALLAIWQLISQAGSMVWGLTAGDYESTRSRCDCQRNTLCNGSLRDALRGEIVPNWAIDQVAICIDVAAALVPNGRQAAYLAASHQCFSNRYPTGCRTLAIENVIVYYQFWGLFALELRLARPGRLTPSNYIG